MAKRRFAIARRYPRIRYRTRTLARRGSTAAARAAMTERHTLAAVGTAFAYGFLKDKIRTALPAIPGFAPEVTFGLGLWVAGKWWKSRTIEHMATGMLAVAAANLGQSMATGVSGEDVVDF